MKVRLETLRKILLVAFLALGAVASVANAQTAATPAKKHTPPTKSTRAVPPKPELEPKAIELLKASSARLAAAHTLSFTAVEIFEHPSRHGHPLAYTTKSDITLQRPNRLKVLIAGDGPASEFYYDGKIMMAYAPAENLLAVADAPATVDATLEAAYNLAGIYFPFTDLIVTDPYKDMAGGLMLAYYVGQSQVVGGTTTDIVAYIDKDVFLQVWIGVEDKLPRMVHAVFLADPERLRHELQLSNWQLDGPVSLDAFSPSSASTAKRMPFSHPLSQSSPASKPAASTAAPK